MIRIRPIADDVLPTNKAVLEQVKKIFKQNFTDMPEYADRIVDMFSKPIEHGYESTLLVSESASGAISGFSFFSYFPELKCSFLDFIAVSRDIRGKGIGSALYEATREFQIGFKSRGLYMDVQPDDPALVNDPKILKENQNRMRFYENYGVRPIIGTEYETPFDDSTPPYLLFDSLGRKAPLRRSEARAVVRALLTKKFHDLVSPLYIEQVVESFIDDPVRIREPRYTRKEPEVKVTSNRLEKPFAVISSDVHQVHHVRELGYVERPARVSALRETVKKLGIFDEIPVRHFSESKIKAVHQPAFVNYLRTVCTNFKGKRPVYPYVFPIRRPDRQPKDREMRAGYYCIDTFTPLDSNAYNAARAAVDVALTGAQEILKGRRVAYAICRPPGHHSESRCFGGFCYFNNAAIAANMFSDHGKTAILDLDFHHGNGQQDIFYERNDVLTVSIHGHPNITYPHFTGFRDEVGEGEGKRFNCNFPLFEDTDEAAYLAVLRKAIARVEAYKPMFLIVCLGLDTLTGDPTGAFQMRPPVMKDVGQMIARLHLPTLVTQEGGYSIRNLRRGAAAFFTGMRSGVMSTLAANSKPR